MGHVAKVPRFVLPQFDIDAFENGARDRIQAQWIKALRSRQGLSLVLLVLVAHLGNDWAVVVPTRSLSKVLRVPLDVRRALGIKVFEVRDDEVVEHLV
jgi:hypothetical protein